jgi:hypothetical protein
VRSDHKLHIIDWKSGTEIDKATPEEITTKIDSNKRKGSELTKEDWEEYKDKVDEKIKKTKN